MYVFYQLQSNSVILSRLLAVSDTGKTLNTGRKLYLQQLHAMFLKRVINSRRSPLVTVVQILVPVVFTALGCIVQYTLPNDSDPPALAVGLSKFRDPIVPYKGQCLAKRLFSGLGVG